MTLDFHLRVSRLLYVLYDLRSNLSLSLSLCLLHALRPVLHQSTNGPSKVQQHWGALEDYLEHNLEEKPGKNTHR